MLLPVRLLLLALAAVTGSAACGDDDEPASGAGTTIADEADQDDVARDGSTAPAEPTTTTTPGVVGAEDPPGAGAGEDEGLGDPLVLVADLTGAAEVPGPGDEGATGRFEARSGDGGELCVDMEVTGLDSTVTDAHVHEGAVGASGDVEIPIGAPTTTDGDTDIWVDVCVAVESDLLEDLTASTDAFYVNVHTETFGSGAVRGQLALGSLFDLTLD